MASASKPVDRARKAVRDFLYGGRFTCACCPGKEFRGHKALNAHHLARHGSYWAGDKAKKTGRKIGKAADAARKHARGWREAHGLADRYGNATAKSRARPELRGRLRIRDLRRAHRHGKDHDRTQERAARHDRRAERARVKGRADWEGIHTARAQDTRDRHAQAWPERKPAARTAPEPGRPAPQMSRPAPAANGHANGRANGRTKEPTGRTRS